MRACLQARARTRVRDGQGGGAEARRLGEATPPSPRAAAPEEGRDTVTSVGAALCIRVSCCRSSCRLGTGPGSPLLSEGSGLLSTLSPTPWPSVPRRRPGGAKKTREPRLPAGWVRPGKAGHGGSGLRAGLGWTSEGWVPLGQPERGRSEGYPT